MRLIFAGAQEDVLDMWILIFWSVRLICFLFKDCHSLKENQTSSVEVTLIAKGLAPHTIDSLNVDTIKYADSSL